MRRLCLRHSLQWLQSESYENHRVFLRYLERRVGDRALGEDTLQDAFAEVIASPTAEGNASPEDMQQMLQRRCESGFTS